MHLSPALKRLQSVALLTLVIIFLRGTLLADAGVGMLDPNFDAGKGADGLVLAICPLRSGKVLIGGTFSSYDGVKRTGLAMILKNGHLDTGFNPDITLQEGGGVLAIYEDEQNRIYIGGAFSAIGGTGRPSMARLLPTGQLDTSFSPDLPSPCIVTSISPSSDRQTLYAAGLFVYKDKPLDRFGLVRLKLGGSRDYSFTLQAITALGVDPLAYTVCPTMDGKVYLGGDFGSQSEKCYSCLGRFDAEGLWDKMFVRYRYAFHCVSDIKIEADGCVLIAGNRLERDVGDKVQNPIQRLNADGSCDLSFSPSFGKATGIYGPWINSVRVLSDGRVLAVGDFQEVNGQTRQRIARLFRDGSLDTTFATSVDEEIVCLAEDSDGYIWIGGGFSTVSQRASRGVARLTRDGDKPIEMRRIPNQIVSEGENLILRTDVFGADGDYTWYFNGNEIQGSAGSSLAVADLRVPQSGSYSYSVKNRFGVFYSEPIIITIVPYAVGSVDSQFDSKREPLDKAWTLGVLNDGSWVAGELSGGNIVLHFYTKDFQPAGKKMLPGVRADRLDMIKSDKRGRIWLIYRLYTTILNSKAVLLRLTKSFEIDKAFDSSELGAISDFQVNADDSVVVQGSPYTFPSNTHLMRLLENGRVDTNYGISDSSNGMVPSLAVIDDGSAFYVPETSDFSGRLQLRKFTADGRRDDTFLPPKVMGLGKGGQQWELDAITNVAIAPGGDIVVIARNRVYTKKMVVRLSSSGQLKSRYWADTTNRLHCNFIGVDALGGVVVACSESEYIDYRSVDLRRIDVNGNLTSQGISVFKYPIQNVINTPDGGSYIRSSDLANATAGEILGGGDMRKLHLESRGTFNLVGIAGRGHADPGDESLILGYVGGGERSSVILRGMGPALLKDGITDADPDPAISLYDGTGRLVGRNDDWASEGADEKAGYFRKIGLSVPAFGSKDACIVAAGTAGAYSFIVSSKSSRPGIGLGEIYEGTANSGYLRALALRGRSGSGDEVLIAGFVTSGSGGCWVLVRAVGPGMSKDGVTGTLADPVLSIYDSRSSLIAENDNWSAGDNGLLVEAAARKLGMGQLDVGSRDAAVLVWLNPGAYTAVARDRNGGTGNALIEIYPLF